jgi:hypothetical protein
LQVNGEWIEPNQALRAANSSQPAISTATPTDVGNFGIADDAKVRLG